MNEETSAHGLSKDLSVIEEIRERVIRNDSRYMSPLATHLIEKEIPRLIEEVRDCRDSK